MYKVSVSEDFIAQHFLIGGDWGAENTKHSHHFKLMIEIQGRQLNEHGYLFDISVLQKIQKDIVGSFRDQCLNDLQEFEGLNPSVEHFCRIISEKVSSKLDAPELESLEIRLWEDNSAWCSYTCSLSAYNSGPEIFRN